MSDDEGRLVIVDPHSPDNGRLLIADDSPRKSYFLEEINPCGVSINGSSKEEYDPDLTPPMIQREMQMDENEESMEDGEIAEDDEMTPEEQRNQNMSSHPSNRDSPLKSLSRSSRESRDERSNGSSGDSHSSRKGSSHAHSAAGSHHSYPHYRGAPGGVRSKPDPLSTPHSLAPAGHLRKAIDHERKDRPLPSQQCSISSPCVPSRTLFGMALDVPPAVPSPALTEIIERGERGEERKRENGERRTSLSSTSSHEEKKERNERAQSTSSSTSITANGRKRESMMSAIKEEKESVEPPEKKRRHKEEREEREGTEEEGKDKSRSPSVVSRGTSVGIQADRDEAIMNLPAGSSVTLTFTVVCRVDTGLPGALNTMYISTMVGGREMTGVLTDAEAMGLRRRSLASSSSSDDSGNRHGTPSKSFRGCGTPRDKRARNGVERKRRVQVENEDEEVAVEGNGSGEGTSTGNQRMTLVEMAPEREMHHCPFENCEFRFPRSSELEYHKAEMHRQKKVMKEDLASQTVVSSFHRSSIECQTDEVETKKEEKAIKTERKDEERIKQNGGPALTIQTGAGPSSSSTPSMVGGGTLLMKASPSAVAPSTPTTAAGGTETAGTHTIHHPIAVAASSSSSMPTLTPVLSTPSTPSSSKPPRLPVPSSSSSRPSLVLPQLPPGLFGATPATPGTPVHAMQQMMQMQQMQQAMQMQHAAAAAAQQKPPAPSTQHKINELKVKDEAGPSTSGSAHHSSMGKVSTAPSLPSPAAATTQQRQQMQQGFPGYPMMGLPPSSAQQQQMMMNAAMQNQFLAQMMMYGGRPPPQPQPMQLPHGLSPEQFAMMQQMMMQHQQQQQK